MTKILLSSSFLLFCAAAVVLVSCGPVRQLTATDTRKVEVRETTRLVPYLVQVSIPEIQETRRTRDTSSHLENKYAVSDAIVHPDGTLEHSLRTKPQDVPQIVDVPQIQRDSIIEHETIIEKEKPLTRDQRIKLALFWPIAIVAGLLALLTALRRIFHF